MKNREVLKSYFQRGKYPTEQQYAELIDSLRHFLDPINVSDVIGLQRALNGKAGVEVTETLNEILERIDNGEVGGMTPEQLQTLEDLAETVCNLTTKDCGYFPTVADLQTAVPSPVEGQSATVGPNFEIYACITAGTWAATGEKTRFTSEPVSSLPANPDAHTIYILPGQDSWTENVYSNGSWVVLATHSGAMSQTDPIPIPESTNPVQSSGTYNAINPSTSTDDSCPHFLKVSGSYVDSDGSIKSNVNFAGTGYIDIAEVSSIVYNTNHYCCFYDENKSKVGSAFMGNSTDTTITSADFPSGAKYVYLSARSAYKSSFKCFLHKISKKTRKLSVAMDDIYGSESVEYYQTGLSVDNKYINYSTGEEGSNPNYACSSFIELTDDIVSIKYKITNNQYNTCVAFYDSSKAYLQTYWPSGEYIIPKSFFPEGAAYVRFCAQDTSASYIRECYLGKAVQSGGSINSRLCQLETTSFLSKFSGKKIAILGDSISSFNGWLPSSVDGYTGSTYAYHYPAGNVTTVDLTWWYKMAVALGIDPSTQINNCSWSGSQVCGDSTQTSSDTAGSYGYCGCSTKRIEDMSIRGDEPDIVIIHLGCNDWGRGEVNLGSWTIDSAIPSEGTINEFRSAYALMLYKIQNRYPNARIYCCTITEDTKRDKTTGYPSTNSKNVSLHTWNASIKEIANAFCCDVIDLNCCGMTLFNTSDNTIDGLHPNTNGMNLLCGKAVAELCAKY